MKTASLVVWKRNENRSHIFVSALGGDTLFLKPFYLEVFKTCASELKNNKLGSFVDLWCKTCDNVVKKAFTEISKHVEHDEAGDWSEAVEKVTTKMRGNLGEMLVELMAENGMLDFIKPGTYEPVDPENEEYIDATAKRNGLPVGIQVKNYSSHNTIDDIVFLKAAAMSDLWLRRDGGIKDEDLKEFTKTPCQYIISTSRSRNELLEERFKGSVVFLGPSWIDARKIQGSSKTGESSKWKMFEEACDEIEAVK